MATGHLEASAEGSWREGSGEPGTWFPGTLALNRVLGSGELDVDGAAPGDGACAGTRWGQPCVVWREGAGTGRTVQHPSRR